MNKTAKYVLIGTGIAAAITGIILIPKMLSAKDKKEEAIDYDVEIRKILATWATMSQEERNAMVKNKLSVAEGVRAITLMAEYTKSGKNTSQADKEELYRLLSRLFVADFKNASSGAEAAQNRCTRTGGVWDGGFCTYPTQRTN